MAQETEITIEVEETVVLKQGGKIISEHCPRCCEVVDMVSPDVLSLVTGTSEREIFYLIEAGEIFFTERGRLLACPVCLQVSFRKSRAETDRTLTSSR